MLRTTVLAMLWLLAAAQLAPAQDWARKMFQVTSHDFGTVPRGAKIEYSFELTNLYKENVHIVGVRSSCGCATVRITKPLLKTLEKSAVVAVFNTRSFLGHRNATITVTIDQPYYAEVQLSVAGRIRGDVVLSPGIVDFGSVDQGSPAEKKIVLDYAGRDEWKILDIRSANNHLEVEMTQTWRGGGRVGYELLVRLKEDAPAGYLNDQLILLTNDRNSKQVSLNVAGRVLSAVTVSPASLFMGVLAPGQKVTKQLVVRGKKPFKILSIECSDQCFEFDAPNQAKALHVVPVTFTAGKEMGKITQTIKITTDMGGVTQASLDASAVVKAGDEEKR